MAIPRLKIYKSFKAWFIGIVCFYIFIINLLSYAIYTKSIFDEFEYPLYFFMLSPLFLFPQNFIQKIVYEIDKLLIIAAWILIFSNLYIYINYILFDRLPAHAYVGTLVRFGGLWDDPNGFSFFCVFLFFILWRKKNFITCFGLLINIVFAFSFASYLLFIFSFFYWVIIDRFKIKGIHVLAIIFIITIIILFFLFVITPENIYYFKGIYEAKKGSIEVHKKLLNLNFYFIPLTNEGVQFSETWMLSFFFNYFPISPIAIFGLFHLLFKQIFTRDKSYIIYYITIFIIGMFFLPLLYVFPINFIFILLLILYIKTENVIS